jgi:hypothetical protein
MSKAYTTVDAVLIATCLKLGDKNLSKYAVLNAHATSWFMADYNPESGQTVRTILLDVGPDRVAELPEDYLDFVMVGRQSGDRVRNLAHNPRLSPLPPVEPFLDRTPLDALVGFDWPCYEYAGWNGDSLYGYGWGEYREEFTIDATNRTLRLSSLIGPDEPLFFQYISADLSPHKATPLHPAYALCLEYWVLWQMHLRKNENGPAGNYERLYKAARSKARAQLSPFDYPALQAIISASYNTIH